MRSGTYLSAALQPTDDTVDSGSTTLMFSQFRQLLDAAEAKARGFDELQSSLQIAQQEIQRLEQIIQTLQRQLDSFCTKDRLVSHLTQQVTAQSQALEQREKQIDSAQAQASAVEQELGQKRKRIQKLEADSTSKVQKIGHLEHKLQGYRSICSFVTSHTWVS